MLILLCVDGQRSSLANAMMYTAYKTRRVVCLCIVYNTIYSLLLDSRANILIPSCVVSIRAPGPVSMRNLGFGVKGCQKPLDAAVVVAVAAAARAAVAILRRDNALFCRNR